MNELLTVCLYMAALRAVLTNKLEIKYNVTKGSFYQYGDELGVAFGRSLLECSSKCSQSGVCRSVVFDRAENTCTGNRRKVEGTCNTASGCNASKKVVFASKILQSTLGLDCRDGSDCMDNNTDCQTDNICDCSSGFGYSDAEAKCVADTDTSTHGSYYSGHHHNSYWGWW